MDQQLLKKIAGELVRVVLAAAVLYCIWHVVKTEVMVFQDDDGPRFGLPNAESKAASAPEVSAPAASPAAASGAVR